MLNFSFGRRTPVLLQTGAAECGLACLAMVAGHHGHRIDMATLRLDLERLPQRQLPLPCVLHGDFNHVVVLVKRRGDTLVLSAKSGRYGIRCAALFLVPSCFRAPVRNRRLARPWPAAAPRWWSG